MKLHYISILAPEGKTPLENMEVLCRDLHNCGIYISYEVVQDNHSGELYVYVETKGAIPTWPLWLDLVREREVTAEDEKPGQLVIPFTELIAIPDPIAPERDMPMNYDAFDMASVLVKDKELARTVSADVVQRLAAELLKYKPQEE